MEQAEYNRAVNAGRGIAYANGIWVPRGFEHKAHRYFASAPDMQYAVQMCYERRVAVQAGGNIGAWPQWLSHRFDKVYTFEPEAINFECLLLNAKSTNIYATRAALSDEEENVELVFSKENIGGHSIRRLDYPKAVPKLLPTVTPAVKIDSLNLQTCDLIVLDVEGWEYNALNGGLDTIKAYAPVIMIEERGHGKKKGEGHTFEDIMALLPPGYMIMKRVAHDVVLARPDRRRQ